MIKVLKKYVPDDHYLLSIIRKAEYKSALEKLSSLRNFAAHDSIQSKNLALNVIKQKRIGTAGSWLKVQGRYSEISSSLKALGLEIANTAPY